MRCSRRRAEREHELSYVVDMVLIHPDFIEVASLHEEYGGQTNHRACRLPGP